MIPKYLSLLGLLRLPTLPQVSVGTDYLRDDAPAPDTIEDLQGPLKKAFEKKPGLRERLFDLVGKLRYLLPFLHDTEFILNIRTYYFDRYNADGSENAAWAPGGSLAYQCGWFKDVLSVRAEIFTSQRLYGPESKVGLCQTLGRLSPVRSSMSCKT